MSVEDNRSFIRRSSRTPRGSFPPFHIVAVHRPSNYVYVNSFLVQMAHTLSLLKTLIDECSLRSRRPATQTTAEPSCLPLSTTFLWSFLHFGQSVPLAIMEDHAENGSNVTLSIHSR